MIGKFPEHLLWAQVELFRYEYGELPKDNDKRTIHYCKALSMGADLIRNGKVDPYNASTIVEFAAYMVNQYFKLFIDFKKLQKELKK